MNKQSYGFFRIYETDPLHVDGAGSVVVFALPFVAFGMKAEHGRSPACHGVAELFHIRRPRIE